MNDESKEKERKQLVSKTSDISYNFTTFGCCLFWALAGIGGGGITGLLIFNLVPWSLELPLPFWAYIPLAIVGLALPMLLFYLIYKIVPRHLIFESKPKIP